MKYNVVEIKLRPVEPFRDMLVYALGDEGDYDSFEETNDGLKAYVESRKYDEETLKRAIAENCEGCTVSYRMEPFEDKDWNEEWEKQHQAVLVEDFCWVRAPFHPHREDVEYEIEIEPKMSFGTAHHATTYMMLTYLRDEDLEGKRVLDMGCGTAVLAILAKKRGASYVEGIDIDEWAYRNALENCERNGCGDIVCRIGDASLLGDREFDVVIANINRNILLNDMEKYVDVMTKDGVLLLSGFFTSDVAVLAEKAEELGMRLMQQRERSGWCALRFVKIG